MTIDLDRDPLKQAVDPTPEEQLLATIARFDWYFSHDQAADLDTFFIEDARLMWPFMEDIIGKRAIQAAFEGLFETFTTLSFQPERKLEYLTPDIVINIGRFVEIRKRRDNGKVEKVHGRLVEVWRLQSDSHWRLSTLLTSRYADDEDLTPT